MSPEGTNGHAAPSQNGDRSADLLELADALMERARTLAAQADQLIAALDETARRLVESGQGVEGAPLRVPVSLIKQLGETDESTATNGSAEANGSGPRNGSAARSVPGAARVFISRMAVAGWSREEIATCLREDFQVADADEVLDQIGL
jgi:hypothetical protein